MVTVQIEGAAIRDIASFYDEINRVFMVGVDWQLGPSLDALDDMLYGGYGVTEGADVVEVVWRDHALSRDALGVSVTRRHYEERLSAPERFDQELLRRRIADLDAGRGASYFAQILEVFAGHPRVRLILD